MFDLVKKIIATGIKTENTPEKTDHITQVGEALSRIISKRFSRALNIRMVDAGSCNGCELEINAMNNSYYAIERYGIQFVASPRHADLLLVTGPVTKNMKLALLKTYDAMPNPKLVVAVGDCARNCGVFKNSYAIAGAVSDIIPVNTVISGCPPTPIDIINGILVAISEKNVNVY